LFSVLQVEPLIGRPFGVEEETPTNNHVAILSRSLAEQNFPRADAALGQKIHLSNVPYTVIGVMPSGFRFPGRTDVWVPRLTGRMPLDLGTDPEADRSMAGEEMIGRLRAGIALSQARAELNVMHRQLQDIYRRSEVGFGTGVGVKRLQERLVGNARPAFLTLLVGGAFVLLIACADAAIVLLGHAALRRKEVAVRACLGASRVRVVGQVLTESTSLSLSGGVVGTLLALGGLRIIRAMAPPTIPRLSEIGIDGRVLAFAVGVSLLTGILVGTVPALQTFGPDLTCALKEERTTSAGTFGRRTRQVLVISEVALAVVLVAAASLVVESLHRLTRIAPGFSPQGVITMQMALPRTKYNPSVRMHTSGPASTRSADIPKQGRRPGMSPSAQSTSGEPEPGVDSPNLRVHTFQHALLDRIRSSPEVLAAGLVTEAPLTGAGENLWFDVGGKPQADGAVFFHVQGDYFRTMGIPLIKGRSFTDGDADPRKPVVIVNETLAQRCWMRKDPVGDYLQIEGEQVARQVVGVVGDIKSQTLGDPPEQQFYLPWFEPYHQQPAAMAPRDMVLVVKVRSDSKAVVPLIRDAVRAIDRELPVFRIRTMEEVISESTASPRFRTLILGAFALVALVLAVLGVYGVVAHSAACRTHEIGVMMALGAEPSDVLILVVGEGVRLAAVGAVIGLAMALGLNRLISGLLFGIAGTDALTLAISALSLIASALAASAVPAFRASKNDPVVALRYE
jgi:putative ABC transport system permease protein